MITKVKGEEKGVKESFTYSLCLPFIAYRKDIFGELYACSVVIEFLFKTRSDRKVFDIYISNRLQVTSPPFAPKHPILHPKHPLVTSMLLSLLCYEPKCLKRARWDRTQNSAVTLKKHNVHLEMLTYKLKNVAE